MKVVEIEVILGRAETMFETKASLMELHITNYKLSAFQG